MIVFILFKQEERTLLFLRYLGDAIVSVVPVSQPDCFGFELQREVLGKFCIPL